MAGDPQNHLLLTPINFFKIFSIPSCCFSLKYRYLQTLFKRSNNKKDFVMSRICDLTGKGSMNGHNVSNSNVKTKRKFHPNLKLKKFYIPEEDKWITLKVSTSAVKTISKNGITACINKFVKKGYI